MAQNTSILHDANQSIPSTTVEDIVFSLQIPAHCVAEAVDGITDIALMPVAAIPHLISGSKGSDFKPHIITDYCIGSEGVVDTVVLLSDTPLSEITTIYLDSHSRTSVQLVQLLAREHWAISPRWVDSSVCDSFKMDGSSLAKGEAVMAIGDKVFAMTAGHDYSYRYDLSAEWSAFTGGMPFVFAAWVACTPAGSNFAPTLNEMLSYGVGHISESITCTVNRSQDFEYASAYHYLTERISFILDDRKRASMRLFWKKTIKPG